MRSIDPIARVLAFMDGMQFLGSPQAVWQGREVYRSGLRELDMELNGSKSKLWAPHMSEAGGTRVADWMGLTLVKGVQRRMGRQCRMPEWTRSITLNQDIATANGTRTRTQEEDDETDPGPKAFQVDPTMEDQSLQEFLAGQRDYFATLKALAAAGLTTAHVFVRARTWSHGACVHIQRALPTTPAWRRLVDEGVVELIEHLRSDQLSEAQQQLVFLNVGEGGMGFGSAVARGAPAWFGAWERGLGRCSTGSWF